MKKLLLATALAFGLGFAADAQPLYDIGAPNNLSPVNISSATTTKVASGLAGRAMDLTQFNFFAAGTDTVTLEYGTGGTCGTGTTVIAGPYTMVTSSFVSVGDGFGSLGIIPSGNDLCIVTTGAVVLGGSVSYNTLVGSL